MHAERARLGRHRSEHRCGSRRRCAWSSAARARLAPFLNLARSTDEPLPPRAQPRHARVVRSARRPGCAAAPRGRRRNRQRQAALEAARRPAAGSRPLPRRVRVPARARCERDRLDQRGRACGDAPARGPRWARRRYRSPDRRHGSDACRRVRRDGGLPRHPRVQGDLHPGGAARGSCSAASS